MKICTLFIGFTCLALVGCKAQTSPAYQKDLDAWVVQRVTDLKADDGWLNLVGLHWLQEGKNTFGSGTGNKIIFPKNSIAENAGYFERSGNTVKLVTTGKANIQVDGKAVTEAVIFAPGMQQTPVLLSGNLRWSVIKREDKIGKASTWLRLAV